MSIFVIEDEAHSEWISEFDTREEAMEALRKYALIDWDKEPNLAPCMSWKTCGRTYQLLEFDTANEPCKELSRETLLEISSKGVIWNSENQSL